MNLLSTNLLGIDAYLFVDLGCHEVLGGYREIFNALENSDISFSETLKINIVVVSGASNTVKIGLLTLCTLSYK